MPRKHVGGLQGLRILGAIYVVLITHMRTTNTGKIMKKDITVGFIAVVSENCFYS